jgi:hypothetical protein
MQAGYRAERPLGYQQITSLATSTAIATIPEGAALALIIAEGQAIRWRDDKTAPTATVGQPLDVGVELSYSAQSFAALRFIEQVAGATVNITFYG